MNSDAVIALIGVVVGGILTYFSQLLLLKKEIRRDKERKKEENMIETMDIYSRFLDQNSTIQVMERLNIHEIEMNVDIYIKHIKPIFSQKIYLIHNDVAQIIMDINQQLEISNYNEEFTKEEKEWVVGRYFKLESLVVEHISNFRKNNDLFIE